MPTKKPNQQRLVLFILAAVALAGLLILVSKNIYEGGKDAIRGPRESGTENFTTPLPQFPPQPPEEPVVYSYIGTLKNIDAASGTLLLATARGDKTVHFSDKTTFTRITFMRPSAEPDGVEQQARAPLPETEIDAADIQNGMTVTAFSRTNIRGLNDFTAYKISINQAENL